MKEIDKLKEQGFAVKVSHLRYARPKIAFSADGMEKTTSMLRGLYSTRALRDRGYTPESRGGVTVIRLIAPNGVEFKETVHVSSLDHYNKKLGILICLGRLTKGQAFIDAATVPAVAVPAVAVAPADPTTPPVVETPAPVSLAGDPTLVVTPPAEVAPEAPAPAPTDTPPTT
jgi:hypothetical protein